MQAFTLPFDFFIFLQRFLHAMFSIELRILALVYVAVDESNKLHIYMSTLLLTEVYEIFL